MNHARHEFVALTLAALKGGASPEVAIATADLVIAKADSRYGKEEPEKSIGDQIRALFTDALSDPTFANLFAGIQSEKFPDGTRGVTDYGGNGEPPPREREPLVTEGGKAPANGATPSWK